MANRSNQTWQTESDATENNSAEANNASTAHLIAGGAVGVVVLVVAVTATFFVIRKKRTGVYEVNIEMKNL